MFDPNRLNRVHVATVHHKNNNFYIILSDNTEGEWNYWITLTEKE